jgi:hypothetical protein
MTRSVVGFLVLILATLGLSGSALAGEGENEGQQSLEKKIAHLRAKAHALRERGSVEDAEHVAKTAEVLEKVQALRRQSDELERKGKVLAQDGHADDAERAMKESGRLWKESEEILRRVEAGRAAPNDDMARKIHDLEHRLGLLREAGRTDEASETERLLALLRAARATTDATHAFGRRHDIVFVDKYEAVRAERVKKAIALLRESGLPDLASLVERETKEITQSPKPVLSTPVVVRTHPAQGNEVAELREEMQALRRQLEEIRAVLRDLRHEK